MKDVSTFEIHIFLILPVQELKVVEGEDNWLWQISNLGNLRKVEGHHVFFLCKEAPSHGVWSGS